MPAAPPAARPVEPEPTRAEMRTSLSHPIEVAWLPLDLPGKIGVTFAPGKRSSSLYGTPWDRDLDADLNRLAGLYRVDLLMPLVEDFELNDLKIPNLQEEAERRGMVVWRLPIPDGGTPSVEGARQVARLALSFARAGRRVMIHCRGGLGRAGTLACCCLVTLGRSPAEAIRLVRSVRPGAVENAGQEQFVETFAAHVSPEKQGS